MSIIDIKWYALASGYVLLLVPIAVFLYFQTRLLLPLLTSVLRMTIQLVFVGLYLGVIFERNSLLLNLGWVTVMLVVAALAVVKRGELVRRRFVAPVLLGLVVGTVLTEAVFLGPVLGLDNPFDARYMIPITGMILGNCLNSSVIAMRSFYRGLREGEDTYLYSLACGATRREALAPFVREALQSAFSPVLAGVATIGLVALPGMMTGQILGGSEPLIAVKYQIMIMIAITSGSVTTVMVSIWASSHQAFDAYDRLRSDNFPDET